MLRRYEYFCCYLATVFPWFLTSALYLYGVYAYCFVLSLQIIGGISGLVLSLLGLLLALQALYTYRKVVVVGPGSPLDFPELSLNSSFHDLENSRQEPPHFLTANTVQVKANGQFRFCSKCNCWKPDRSHHCSGCNRCHLKMDHHCPWFSTCVGFRNQKYFIQFLILSILFTTLILTVSGYQIYKFFYDENYQDEFMNLHLLALAMLSLCTSVSTAMFAGVTLYFLFKNLTTIEYYEFSRYRNNLEIVNDSYYRYSNKPTARDLGNLYDLGWKRNWQVVMGSNWIEWCLPIPNAKLYEDSYQNEGLYFESDPYIFERLKSNSDLQNRLLNELRSTGAASRPRKKTERS